MGVTPPPGPETLLQIGRRPPGPTGRIGCPLARATPGGSPSRTWAAEQQAGDSRGRRDRVLLCSVRGTLYAYRDACAACGISLADGTLTLGELACPACGICYDVRSAGRSLGYAPAVHLDPLPLLSDSQGVRVAVRRRGRHPVVSPPSGLRRFVGPPGPAPAPAEPAAAPGPAAPSPFRPRACPGRPARSGPGRSLARPGSAGQRRGTLRVLRHRHPVHPRARGRPGEVQPGLRLPGLLPLVHSGGTGLSTTLRPLPRASAWRVRGAGPGTGRCRTAMCATRPGRCPPWSGTSCRSRSGWRSS